MGQRRAAGPRDRHSTRITEVAPDQKGKSCLLLCAGKARHPVAVITRYDASGAGPRARGFSAGGICLRNRGQANFRPRARTTREAVLPEHQPGLGFVPARSKKRRLSPRAMRHAERLQALSKTQQRFVLRIIDVLEVANGAGTRTDSAPTRAFLNKDDRKAG